MTNNKDTQKVKISDYVQAFLDYLRRPKTLFDIKDRAKAAVLLGTIIILLQMVVEMLCD